MVTGALGLVGLVLSAGMAQVVTTTRDDNPVIVVLGIAQDGGVPQAGCERACCAGRWDDPKARRHVACLAIVDPATSQRWIIDATPDFPLQIRMLGGETPTGVLLTHGHVGHYTGLVQLGHEIMGAKGVDVYAMPRMQAFLSGNGPWDQLVRLGNITLVPLADGERVRLNRRITVTPVLVPHRDEYTETVGYRIDGPHQSALYIPDIDKWSRWDRRVEALIADVEVAYLDGTFFDDSELPGRDMAAIPHPFITESVERFGSLPASQRGKVRFIHLNHSNPALDPDSAARKLVEAAGMHVAEEGERFDL